MSHPPRKGTSMLSHTMRRFCARTSLCATTIGVVLLPSFLTPPVSSAADPAAVLVASVRSDLSKGQGPLVEVRVNGNLVTTRDASSQYLRMDWSLPQVGISGLAGSLPHVFPPVSRSRSGVRGPCGPWPGRGPQGGRCGGGSRVAGHRGGAS